MLAPEVLGIGLLLIALALLIVEQKLFGYEDTELVQKIIMALVNTGLTLIATSYGLMG